MATMALTQVQASVSSLLTVMFNAAAGKNYLKIFTDQVEAGQSIDALAEQLVSSGAFIDLYPATQSNLQFSESWVTSLLGGAVTDPVNVQFAIDYTTDLLEAGASRADVIQSVSELLISISNQDLIWGNASAQLENKLVTAMNFSEARPSSDLATLQDVIANVNWELTTIPPAFTPIDTTQVNYWMLDDAAIDYVNEPLLNIERSGVMFTIDGVHYSISMEFAIGTTKVSWDNFAAGLQEVITAKIASGETVFEGLTVVVDYNYTEVMFNDAAIEVTVPAISIIDSNARSLMSIGYTSYEEITPNFDGTNLNHNNVTPLMIPQPTPLADTTQVNYWMLDGIGDTLAPLRGLIFTGVRLSIDGVDYEIEIEDAVVEKKITWVDFAEGLQDIITAKVASGDTAYEGLTVVVDVNNTQESFNDKGIEVLIPSISIIDANSRVLIATGFSVPEGITSGFDYHSAYDNVTPPAESSPSAINLTLDQSATELEPLAQLSMESTGKNIASPYNDLIGEEIYSQNAFSEFEPQINFTGSPTDAEYIIIN
jgi:hypothetical protein